MLHRVLIGLVTFALLAFIFGITEVNSTPVIWRHMLFAAGVVPLILGAMLYFIPVLTRTASAATGVLWLPVFAAGSGVAAVTTFIWRPELIIWVAALLSLVLLVTMAWILRRREQMLGNAHPGLNWYFAALFALLLALAAIMLREVYVEHWAALRRIHVHLNLLGFLGLTAIGTLRVLLPTVLATTDSAVIHYLRVQLPFAVTAVLCVALGAALWAPLSWLGGAIALWSSALFVKVLRPQLLRSAGMHDAALPLAAAVLGWCLLQLAGLAHGFGLLAADVLIWLLVFLFLLPLVTGASSYLLPLWRWPGKMTPAHARMRSQLMRFSGARVLAFYLSAGMAMLNIDGAQLPAVVALLTYLAQLGWAFMPNRRDAAPSPD